MEGFVSYNEQCNKFIDLCKKYLGKKVSQSDLKNEKTLKKLYHDLSKACHPDLNADGDKVMYEVNLLFEYFNNPFFYMDIDEYRKYVVDKIKADASLYMDIDEFYKNEVSNFETLVVFKKTKDEIYKLFVDLESVLSRKLAFVSCINAKISEFRKYVNGRDSKNVALFKEFIDKANKLLTDKDVEELSASYEFSLRKNAILFLVEDSLLSLCRGYNDSVIMSLVDSARREVLTKDCVNNPSLIDKIFKKYSESINLRKVQLDCYLQLVDLQTKNSCANYEGINIEKVFNSVDKVNLEIVFKSLKEQIDGRIDFSKRVSAKICGFLHKFNNNPEFSYTYPFISNEVNKLRGYYNPGDKDLSNFDDILGKLEKVIIKQKSVDLEKAEIKKETLRQEFKKDFKNGVLLSSGETFVNFELGNINTFGGFANFKNRNIKMELPRVVADVYNNLLSVAEYIAKNYNGEMKNERFDAVKRAMNLCLHFSVLCDKATDFSNIVINERVAIDYREFSYKVQELQKIDYLRNSVEEIETKLAVLDQFLNGDDYDRELENMVNKKK